VFAEESVLRGRSEGAVGATLTSPRIDGSELPPGGGQSPGELSNHLLCPRPLRHCAIGARAPTAVSSTPVGNCRKLGEQLAHPAPNLGMVLG
jgi:hypothetical protein